VIEKFRPKSFAAPTVERTVVLRLFDAIVNVIVLHEMTATEPVVDENAG
jgi:hypothetical protein